MAFAKLLNSRPETPYETLPPLHVSVLKVQDRPKVLSWTFTENSAMPGVVKANKVAAITDGHSITAVTLFEEFSGRVKEGSSYILKGHELRGEGPPYQINVTRRTQFFRASTLKVDDHLKERATALLEPPSPVTSLSASLETTTVMTVEGEVVEISAVKSVGSMRQKIPLKNIRIKQDQHIIPVSLWREAAVVAMAVGDIVTISHVKASRTTYGAQLQSTALTKIKAKEEVRTSTFIIGVMEGEQEDSLRVLFEDGETALISSEMWAPFDEQLKSKKVNVQIRQEGKKITEIREM